MTNFEMLAARAGRTLLGLSLLAAVGCGTENKPQPVPEGTQVLLSDGDQLLPNFEILSIESANMAADRSISFIASRTGADSLNGVFLRTPQGLIRTVLAPDSPLVGNLSMKTVRKLNMAQSGQFAFSVSDQLDSNALFYSDGVETTLIATTESDVPLADFRIVGELRVEEGGVMAFSDGTDPCTVDTSGATQRIRCTLRLQYGPPGDINEVQLENDLNDQNPNAIILQVNENQQAAVGLPARGSEAYVGILDQGVFTPILFRREEIPGLGVLTNAKPRAISNDGTIAIDGGFDTDGDGDRDISRVLRYRQGVLGSAASTGDSIPFGSGEIIDLNAVALDAVGRVYYIAEFEGGGDERDLLRVWDGTTNRDIIWQGKGFGGKTDLGQALEITQIFQTRVHSDGTVLMVVSLGYYEEGTRRITSRQLLRWKNGQLDTLLESTTAIDGGTLVGFDIADLNREGDLLLIGEINAKSNRALVLIPREDVLLP